MIFSAPKPFAEALQSAEVKSILPTAASSAELMDITPALRERALFSARTTNAQYLGRIGAVIDGILSPEAAGIGETMDPATARLMLKQALAEIDYQPDPDVRGTMRDLSSDQRLNLIIETNVRMAQNYGYWTQGQDPAVLDAFPAQELFRAEAREQERDWRARWLQKGGNLFADRMIAPKNAPVWTAISAFGLPYPPFDFNSGMDLRDIDRNEAVDLGVITDGAVIQPESRDFNEDLEVSAPDRQSALFDALLRSLGPRATFDDGALRLQT